MENPEPSNPTVEVVDVGTTFYDTAFTLRYTPTRKG